MRIFHANRKKAFYGRIFGRFSVIPECGPSPPALFRNSYLSAIDKKNHKCNGDTGSIRAIRGLSYPAMHRTLPRRAKNPGRIKLRTRRYILIFAGLLIAALALAAPAGATGTYTISASGSDVLDNANLTAALGNAGSGGTVILNPGTYSIYGITVADSVTIRANTSYGHTAADTIIDGMQNGNSIFTVTGGNQTDPVVFDSLTMRNGKSTNGNGGAILISGGNVSITSSTFTGCSATIYGGAIDNDVGTITAITSSTFTGCSADYGGGAIANGGTITAITSSTFTNCQATGNNQGGGAIINEGTITAITSSTFTNCQATGSNSFGGAIVNGGTIGTITSSTFTGCSADYGGGAIFNSITITAIISSTFTGCTAGDGGAIINEGTITAITASTFTHCQATGSTGFGGAIENEPASTITTIHFSRFFDNTAVIGPAMYNAGHLHSATDNWWGTNASASGSVSGLPVSDYSPWLNLTVTASPSTITYLQTALIQVNLTYDSPTNDTASSGIFVPNGIPVAYSLSGVPGTLGVTGGNITSGANRTVFTPSSTGTAEITVAIDSQQVTVPVMVNNPIPLTGIGATTGTPQVGLPLTNGTVTPAGATVLMQWNESANIDGPYTPIAGATGFTYVLQSSDLGKYIEANATGTGLYAGFANSTPAGPILSPPVTTPAASGGGTSRLDYWANTGGSSDQGYTGPQPTVMGYSQPQGTPVVVQSRQVAGSTPAVARQTVAAPPGTSTAPSGGIPLVSIVAGIAGIGILAGGGFMVRRWWIRRQNPALFRKYD